MFCEECGNKIKDGEKFCTKCGAPAPVVEQVPTPAPAPAPQPVPTPAPQQAPAPKKKSLVPIIAIIIAIVVLVVAGVGIVASGAFDGGFSFGNEVSDRGDDDDEDEDDEEESEEEETEDTETVVDTEEVEATEEEEPEMEIDPNPEVSIAGVTASSNLPAYGSKTYVAENVMDGDINTVWVEGVNGIGEGEYIEFTMDGTQKIHEVVIYNGYLQSYHLYNANGRVSTVLIEFDNGYSVEYELEYSGYGEDSDNPVADYVPNVITLDEPVYANSVRITIVSAVTGDSYEDTCIAEIEFH